MDPDPTKRQPKQPIELSAKDKKEVKFGSEKDYEPFSTRTVYFGEDMAGTIGLKFSKEGNVCEVMEIGILDKYLNMGLGKEILRKVNREVKQKGMILVSGANEPITQEGRRVWESLVRSDEVEYLPPNEYGSRYKFK